MTMVLYSSYEKCIEGYYEMNRLLVLVIFVLSACEEDRLIKLDCAPGAVKYCDYLGNTYDQPNEPRGHFGACRDGLMTCSMNGWSECLGVTGPTEEVCDGIDNDCNGTVDETFPEQQQLCGFEESISYGVGICTPGVMTCESGSLIMCRTYWTHW